MNLRHGDRLRLSLSTLANLVECDLTRDDDGDVVRESERKIQVVAILNEVSQDGVTFEIRSRMEDT